jgi:tRNA (guanine-N7-)-methyltransferase
MPLKNTKNSTDDKLFITRKRKKYKFAKFGELPNCFQADEVGSAEKLQNLFQTPPVRFKRSDPGDIPISAEASGDPVARSAPLTRNGQDGFETDSEDFSSLVLEIGAGTGLFSVELARRHPEKFFVAVDIKSDRLYAGAKLANELGLKNIIFVRSDIWRIGELFPQNSVSEIWITFPDPYANEDQTKLNKSDAKHRLTHPRFLEIYKQLLLRKGPSFTQTGVLHFKTDNSPLFDWSREQFEQNGWKISEQTDDLHGSNLSDDYKIKTSYEERFTAEGLPIHLLTATIKK